jgi:hypothetical protein
MNLFTNQEGGDEKKKTEFEQCRCFVSMQLRFCVQAGKAQSAGRRF